MAAPGGQEEERTDMRHGSLGRWFAGMAMVVLVVTGCAKSSGATEAPPAQRRDRRRRRRQRPAESGPAASGGVAKATCQGNGDKGDVKMMINQWVGAEANVAVAQCLLQQMGYKVRPRRSEEPAWQGFESGEVDVILENWGHPDLEKIYITDKKVAMDAGQTGNVGIIGWYVPNGSRTSTRTSSDPKNLNKYADLFKTSESGDKGQFLGTDPRTSSTTRRSSRTSV